MNKKLIIIIASIVAVVLIAVTGIVIATTNGGDSSSQNSITSGDSSRLDSVEDSSSSNDDTATTYTVSFETNGGSAVLAVEISQGDSINLSEYQTSKQDYYFYSWCLDQTLENRLPNVFTPESDCTLYAEWGSEEKYLLSFETGEGSAIEGVLYTPNAYLATPEEPTRENYSFAGWYKDENYTREFNFFGNTMPRTAITVYAKWVELYAINFDSNGGSAVEKITGEVGEAVTAPEDPTYEGYVFEGWFESLEDEKPYDFTVIPEESITLIAKWHTQQKDVSIELYSNTDYLGLSEKMLTLTADEGVEIENLQESFVDQFTEHVNEYLKDFFLDKTVDLTTKPMFKFNGWTLDAEGKQYFNGKIPASNSTVKLYANWMRSSLYCEVTFTATDESEDDTIYLVVKNSVIDESVINDIEQPLQEKYQPLGCRVDGFYTQSGLRYVLGQPVVMDMELSPYLYSLDLVYEYGTLYNASGNTVYGYMVKGYDPESTLVTKDTQNLILKIPEYYDDGKNGSAPVLWIGEEAFKGYHVTEVSLSKRLLGISNEAFRDTDVEYVEIPAGVYELDDYVFADCKNLETVKFNGSSLSWLGTKIYLNTPYEKNMPTDEKGFVFFNDQKNIIYGYVGEDTEITTPEQANVIAGGAFKGDTGVKKVTFSDNLHLICDKAFEGSVVEEVIIGEKFGAIGYYVFKDCVNLKTVTFTYEYQITYLGYGMFEGCTALERIDLSMLYNLQLINPYAFYNCTNLKIVDICMGVSTINGIVSNFGGVGEYAFSNCYKLSSLSFPSSIQLLDAHCFENSGIASVVIGNSIRTIGAYAFKNCDNIASFNVRNFTMLTTIEEGVFMDCDGLLQVILSDYVTEVKASAFEGCDKLLYVNFGVGDSSQLIKIGDNVFKDCTSLRKAVIYGALRNDIPVSFGSGVFKDAGYTLSDGIFRQPVVYVKAGAPDYSTTSQWKNGNIMYSYKEIYQTIFKNTEYEDLTVKPIDSSKPVLTATVPVIYMQSSDELKQIDLMAYFRDNGLYTVTDNDSKPEDCDVLISKVVHNANGKETTVSAKEGKYDISAMGTYAITLGASDEFGNSTTITVEIVVSASQNP